jgi:hypothetical protein
MNPKDQKTDLNREVLDHVRWLFKWSSLALCLGVATYLFPLKIEVVHYMRFPKNTSYSSPGPWGPTLHVQLDEKHSGSERVER